LAASNAKFHKEDLIKEFAKLGITSGQEAEGEFENVVVPPRQEFYDKKSSFFDNISCESKERAEVPDSGKYVMSNVYFSTQLSITAN
jgi:protein LSM14